MYFSWAKLLTWGAEVSLQAVCDKVVKLNIERVANVFFHFNLPYWFILLTDARRGINSVNDC